MIVSRKTVFTRVETQSIRPRVARAYSVHKKGVALASFGQWGHSLNALLFQCSSGELRHYNSNTRKTQKCLYGGDVLYADPVIVSTALNYIIKPC
jgi:hypothetical protein